MAKMRLVKREYESSGTAQLNRAPDLAEIDYRGSSSLSADPKILRRPSIPRLWQAASLSGLPEVPRSKIGPGTG
jgi:hypothetical protein